MIDKALEHLKKDIKNQLKNNPPEIPKLKILSYIPSDCEEDFFHFVDDLAEEMNIGVYICNEDYGNGNCLMTFRFDFAEEYRNKER